MIEAWHHNHYTGPIEEDQGNLLRQYGLEPND